MSIDNLLNEPNRDKIIEKFFKQLTKVLNPPAELSLPYTTNTKKRRDVLVERIAKLYDIDTTKKSSYKLVRHYADDVVRYPCAFEIIAIPFKEPYGPDKEKYWDKPRPQKFIGAVNYSVSPKNNIFEGEYHPKGYVNNDIMGVLRVYGFQEYGAPYNKLPCIIVGNLITPKWDPQGYDKSSIDTKPFINLIISAIEKISSEIQTYRAAGWRFSGRYDKDVRKVDTNTKVNAKNVVRQFLIQERGLPAVRDEKLLIQMESEQAKWQV
jgi:hypothetical protein